MRQKVITQRLAAYLTPRKQRSSMYYRPLPTWPFFICRIYFCSIQIICNVSCYITYTSRWGAAPGAVGLAHACRWAHQHVGGATAVKHLRFEDKTLAFSLGLSRDAWIATELGCKMIKKSVLNSGFWLVRECIWGMFLRSKETFLLLLCLFSMDLSQYYMQLWMHK